MAGVNIYTAALTGAFALLALWTHTTVIVFSEVLHTLHALRTGVLLTHIVQNRTLVTWNERRRHSETALPDGDVAGTRRRVCTFALARCRPHVPRGHKAEASRTVSGHGAFVQRDQLVTETQRTLQTCAELLDHPDDPDPRHLFNHPGRRI